jgi:hypothetical protein
MEVKQAVLEKQQTQDASIILYHLDSANLSKYTNNEIDQMYSRN